MTYERAVTDKPVRYVPRLDDPADTVFSVAGGLQGEAVGCVGFHGVNDRVYLTPTAVLDRRDGLTAIAEGRGDAQPLAVEIPGVEGRRLTVERRTDARVSVVVHGPGRSVEDVIDLGCAAAFARELLRNAETGIEFAPRLRSGEVPRRFYQTYEHAVLPRSDHQGRLVNGSPHFGGLEYEPDHRQVRRTPTGFVYEPNGRPTDTLLSVAEAITSPEAGDAAGPWVRAWFGSLHQDTVMIRPDVVLCIRRAYPLVFDGSFGDKPRRMNFAGRDGTSLTVVRSPASTIATIHGGTRAVELAMDGRAARAAVARLVENADQAISFHEELVREADHRREA